MASTTGGERHFAAAAERAFIPFDHTFKKFDYKIGFEYDVAPRIMLYATYQPAISPAFNEVDILPSGGSNLVKSGQDEGYIRRLQGTLPRQHAADQQRAFYYIYNDLAIQAYDASKLFNEIFNAKR